MTDKLYLITDAEIEQFCTFVRNGATSKATVLKRKLLQSLPMVDSEPVKEIDLPDHNDTDAFYGVIGARIKAARESKLPKVTQGMIAERMGMQPSSVSNIELGKQHPSLATLIKICVILDIDLFDIIGEKSKFQAGNTSPQPLQPITADDVTGEMISNYVSAHQNIGSPMLSEQIAAAYNAVIKHRSEAK